MDSSYLRDRAAQRGGFDFSNWRRNEMLLASEIASKIPKTRKTGTTICGVKCADAVILGADTRATEGMVVADKNCEKLHHLADNIYCAGAGTSADLEHTTGLMASNLELHRLSTNTQPRVCTVVSMMSQFLFKYQGYVSCSLVLGGVDISGPQLYKIFPHGSTDRSPFAAMGSGSLCADSVLEMGYKDGMSIEEGKELAASAIKAGVFNDLGSGGNIDLVVITKTETTYLRGYCTPNDRLFRMPKPISFAVGTTPTLLEKIEAVKKQIVVEELRADDNDVAMTTTY